MLQNKGKNVENCPFHRFSRYSQRDKPHENDLYFNFVAEIIKTKTYEDNETFIVCSAGDFRVKS